MWAPEQSTAAGVAAVLGKTPQSYSEVQALRDTLPDLPGYLVHLLAFANDSPPYTRQAAGLMLKSDLSRIAAIPSNIAEYVRAGLLSALLLDSGPLRSTAALGIAALVRALPTNIPITTSFPELLPALLAAMEPSQPPHHRHGALLAASHLLEDAAHLLDADPSRPLTHLVPKLISSVEPSTGPHLPLALRAITHLAYLAPRSIAPALQEFLPALLRVVDTPAAAADSQSAAADPRAAAARAAVALLETRAITPDLESHLPRLVEFMIVASKGAVAGGSEHVALEAGEFWIHCHAHQPVCLVVRHYLAQIVPLLLVNMVYTPEECAQIDAEAVADATEPDHPEDVHPHLSYQRARQAKTAAGGGRDDDAGDAADQTSQNPAGPSPDGIDCQQDDELDNLDSNAREQAVDTSWSVRKCSAAGLENVARIFGVEILPVLLPLLQDRLLAENTHWAVRESGVLALGAVAPGCYKGMVPHLPLLVPYLIELLKDPSHMVRSIACWTLSRYGRWVVMQKEGLSMQNGHQYDGRIMFRQLLQHVLECVLDDRKVVQAAGCSAFASLAEDGEDELKEFLSPILQSLRVALTKYQQKNILALYDAIGTLGRCVGPEFGKREHVDIILPPLIARWNALSEDDPAILPLCECIGSVFMGMGPGSQPYAHPVFERALGLIERCLGRQQSATPHDIDLDLVVCNLELMVGMSEGLATLMESLVSGSSLTRVLYVLIKDSERGVKQSALSLVGELAKYGSGTLKQVLVGFLPVVVENINIEHTHACNNAIWALGEIAVMVGHTTLRHPGEKQTLLGPVMEQALQRLVPLINQRHLHRSVLENTAITLGRLGMVMPETVAPVLGSFAQSVCMSLRNIRDDVEKEHAFRGLCAMIKQNPSGMVQAFAYFCDAVGSWYHVRPDLELEFRNILTGYKNSMGQGWAGYFDTFPPALRSIMQDRYGL